MLVLFYTANILVYNNLPPPYVNFAKKVMIFLQNSHTLYYICTQFISGKFVLTECRDERICL